MRFLFYFLLSRWSAGPPERCWSLHPRIAGYRSQAKRLTIGANESFSRSITQQAFNGIFNFGHHFVSLLAEHIISPKPLRYSPILHLGTRPVGSRNPTLDVCWNTWQNQSLLWCSKTCKNRSNNRPSQSNISQIFGNKTSKSKIDFIIFKFIAPLTQAFNSFSIVWQNFRIMKLIVVQLLQL